jgi:hypothetical protein
MNRVFLHPHKTPWLRVAAGFLASMNLMMFLTAEAQARPLGKPKGNNSSGAVRGACPTTDQSRPLIAIVDSSDPALTTQERPTLLFYLPFGKTLNFASKDGSVYNITTAQFELMDENENPVLTNEALQVALPDKPGIVSLTLPKTETVLQPNKEYFWVFRIICDPNDNTANPNVSGWIKRVKPNAAQNIWFDRVAQAIKTRQKNPTDWAKILQIRNLQDFASTPITPLK